MRFIALTSCGLPQKACFCAKPIAFVIFAALTLAYVVLNEDLKDKKQKLNFAGKGRAFEKADTVKLLTDKDFDYVETRYRKHDGTFSRRKQNAKTRINHSKYCKKLFENSKCIVLVIEDDQHYSPAMIAGL